MPSLKRAASAALVGLATIVPLGVGAAEPQTGVVQSAQSGPQSVPRPDPDRNALAAAAPSLGTHLAALLDRAQYRRGPGLDSQPPPVITPLARALAALSAHEGPSLVVIADRGASDNALSVRQVLRGDGSPGTGEWPGVAPEASGKAAFRLALDAEGDASLLDALNQDLRAVFEAGDNPASTSDHRTLPPLGSPGQVAFLILARRDSVGGMLRLDQVFVVPDILRISIRDDASALAASPA